MAEIYPLIDSGEPLKSDYKEISASWSNSSMIESPVGGRLLIHRIYVTTLDGTGVPVANTITFRDSASPAAEIATVAVAANGGAELNGPIMLREGGYLQVKVTVTSNLKAVVIYQQAVRG